MRLLTPAVAIVLFVFPAAGPAGNLRADDSFKVPRGEFSVPPGTFKPSGDFKPTPGDFKPAAGTFRPSQDFRPESGSFVTKPGTFKPPVAQFSPNADFTVHPGTFYIGRGFLKSEDVKEEKPKPQSSNDDKK
ncbi:MAG TPA: hypothetical protein VEU62_10340 [Bryobacterales bacterium]|nr:hypothetical protein [Bryobacterales bacterium]